MLCYGVMNKLEKDGTKVNATVVLSIGQAILAAKAGAHNITIPPPVLTKMADHKHTREAVWQFVDDAWKALGDMEK